MPLAWKDHPQERISFSEVLDRLDTLEELEFSIDYTETNSTKETYTDIAEENNNQMRQLENFNKTYNKELFSEVYHRLFNLLLKDFINSLSLKRITYYTFI
jgi:hypothetical protein